MINGINSGLQSVLQSVAAQSERSLQVEKTSPSPAAAQEGEGVKVSLSQTAQAKAEKTMADYRALGQKTVMANNESAESKAYEAQEQATKFRQQAFLATAALKSGA